MSQTKAVAKSLRISPRKLGLVAGLVRGRSVKDTVVILQHTPRKGAPLLLKVVKSAAANAETNHKMNQDSLAVKSVLVSPGSTIKRYRAGARGMIRPQAHRTSHVTVVVEDSVKPTGQPAARVQKPKTAKKPTAKSSTSKDKK